MHGYCHNLLLYHSYLDLCYLIQITNRKKHKIIINTMNFNLEFDQRTDTGGYTDLKRSNRQSASAFIIYKERWLVLASFSVFAYLL